MRSQGVPELAESMTDSVFEDPNSIDQVEVLHSNESPRIFALIIGINEYLDEEVRNLQGAVADAEVIRDLLKDKLRVESTHIHMLTNSNATRRNIIEAFVSIQNNSEIRKGDAILVYYAGHGQEVEAPCGWPTESGSNMVQSIVPHDFAMLGNVHVIPDITIGSLLGDIMTKKGDNITVIFDCCNSGSGTRDADSHKLVRSASLKNYSVPFDLDEDITKPHRERAAAQSTKQSLGSFQSHVLLAACSAYELAIEIGGRGQFTAALVKALISVPLSQISYVDLMDRLEHIYGQNPQLEGVNRHRMVFNGKFVPRTRNLYKVDVSPNSQPVIRAGAAHGLGMKAEFTLYADKPAYRANKPFGVYAVQHIGTFRTVLSQPISLSNSSQTLGNLAVAIQTKAGVQEELKLHVPLDEGLLPVFEKLLMRSNQSSSPPQFRFALVDRSAADLEVKRDGDDIVFCHLDRRVTSYGLTQCMFKVKLDLEPTTTLRQIIQGAAHYYYHLNRSYLTSDNLRDYLTIEFMELKEVESGWMPTGENLIKDGMITLDIDDKTETVYGIRIRNHGGSDLYPNLFYFDNSALSIESYYSSGEQLQQFQTDSPLPKNGGQLNLGFGNGGTFAYQYYLSDDQDVDVGFLKFFFSTMPVDLSSIVQESPFTSLRNNEDIQYNNANNPAAWCSVLIPIVQKRSLRCESESL